MLVAQPPLNKISVNLDDGMAFTIVNFEISILGASFVPYKSKSIWDPVQCVKWFGFKWNLKQGCVSVPIDEIDQLFPIISFVINARHVGQLASVTGKIISNMLFLLKHHYNDQTMHCSH